MISPERRGEVGGGAEVDSPERGGGMFFSGIRY